MKTKDFLAAARTLSTDHGLAVVGCLQKRGWAIASEIAEDLAIHISTASRDLSILCDCGLLDRRMSRRKTRPAYEYRLKSNRIVLELDLDSQSEGTREELIRVYLYFFDRLFLKTKKMGWSPLEQDVAKSLGDGGERISDILVRIFGTAKSTDGTTELRSIFRNVIGEIRSVFIKNLGNAATERMFQAAASETIEEHRAVAGKHSFAADLGVILID